LVITLAFSITITSVCHDNIGQGTEMWMATSNGSSVGGGSGSGRDVHNATIVSCNESNEWSDVDLHDLLRRRRLEAIWVLVM